MNLMNLVGVEVTLVGDAPLTDDQVTDLIEAIVDDLDHLPVEPSVGSRRDGDTVVMTIEVVVPDHDDEWDALDEGVATIRASMHAAGVGTATWVRPSSLRTSIRQLEFA